MELDRSRHLKEYIAGGQRRLPLAVDVDGGLLIDKESGAVGQTNAAAFAGPGGHAVAGLETGEIGGPAVAAALAGQPHPCQGAWFRAWRHGSASTYLRAAAKASPGR